MPQPEENDPESQIPATEPAGFETLDQALDLTEFAEPISERDVPTERDGVSSTLRSAGVHGGKGRLELLMQLGDRRDWDELDRLDGRVAQDELGEGEDASLERPVPEEYDSD